MTGPVTCHRIGMVENPSFWSGTTPIVASGFVLWMSASTVVSGVATFYPTTTGAASGTTLFKDIAIAVVTAERNTASGVLVPASGIKSISADNRTVTANVVVGTTLLALGDTFLFASDATKVYCLLAGTPY